MLGRSLQRYAHVSKAQRRAISSAPGPMFHLNRLGRRKMTDLNAFQCAASLPAWALPDAPNMMEWQWQPPKPDLWAPWPSSSPHVPPTPETPTPIPPPEAVSSQLSSPVEIPVQELLPAQPLVSSQLSPPVEVTMQEHLPAQPLVSSQLSPPVEVTMQEHLPDQVWQSLHIDLHDIRTNYRGSAGMHTSKFQVFLQKFSQTLSTGHMSGPSAASVYDTALKDIDFIQRLYPESARGLRLCLMSAFADGVRSAEKDALELLIPAGFWDRYMLLIADLEPTVHTADLLVLGMSKLRRRHGRRHYNILVKSLSRFLELWQSSELHEEAEPWDQFQISSAVHTAATWCERNTFRLMALEKMLADGNVQRAKPEVAKIKECLDRTERYILKAVVMMSNDSMIAERLANGLDSMHSKDHSVLLRQLTRLVGYSPVIWTRLSYNWLQVLARLPTISPNQFTTLLSTPSGDGALTHTEFSQLLLLHWESIGRIELRWEKPDKWQERRDAFCRLGRAKDSTPLADLALLINKNTSRRECTGIFWCLWKALRVQRRTSAFLKQVFALMNREHLSRNFMKRLAWTSNDHRVALILHEGFGQQVGKDKGFFWPAFWDKYAALLETSEEPVHGSGKLLRKLLRPDPNVRPRKASTSKDLEGQPRTSRRQEATRPEDTVTANDEDPTPEERGLLPTKVQKPGQLERLQKGLMLLKANRHLTNRQAINLATIFTAVLANAQGFLTARNLATLTALVMRTLDEGRCGSKQRFKWYLTVITRFIGEGPSRHVDQILRRRRDANWRNWQRRKALAAAARAHQYELASYKATL